MRFTSKEALENAKRAERASRLAGKTDARYRAGSIFPDIVPSFTLKPAEKIFTIGSCFARNIERELARDHVIPTTDIKFPKEEWPHDAGNGLLNEYNAGTIVQRITHALEGRAFGELGIAETAGGVVDLLLPSNTAVSLERLQERRDEIDAVYSHLKSSDMVIITLGLVEAWRDRASGLFLNRMPPISALRGDKFELIIMDVDDAYPMLERAVSAMVDHGISKILVTVSPVPLQATFSGIDCFSANSFSKAVLRVCATRLAQRFAQVDYFPSFEIVTYGGASVMHDDNVHVLPGFIREVTGHMVRVYSQK